MTQHKESWVQISEYLSGNKAVLDDISKELQNYCLAIGVFSKRFQTHESIIPRSVLPQFELPLILATHCMMNQTPIKEAIIAIIPTLTVARIQVSADQDVWNPRVESVQDFIQASKGKAIIRTVRATPDERVAQWWVDALNNIREQDQLCGGGEQSRNKAQQSIPSNLAMH
jgi:hypothetical protein